MAADLIARIRHQVLDVDLTIPLNPAAPVTVVFGPSGAGKTTLLRCLAGLAHPGADAYIQLRDQIWQKGRRIVPARRRRIGYLFQDHALFPNMSVDANVAYGIRHIPRHARPARVRRALEDARAAHLSGRDTPALSGGEAQRVALARALASDPELLLLDEPFSALDLPTRDQLRTDLRQILLDTGTPALLVTHDRSEAGALADRVIVIVDGRIHQIGTLEETFNRPTTIEAARAVGVENILPGRITKVSGENIQVRVGQHTLTTANPHRLDAGQNMNVCIRAENVALLADGAPSAGEANRLTARVANVSERGAIHQVRLDTTPAITAYALGSANLSALHPGAAVRAHLPAEHCHTIPTT